MIPLLEIKGKAANGLPEHIGAIGVNVGTILVFTVTGLITLVLAQPPTPTSSYFMSAVPALTPVISPVLVFTVATLGLEDDHVPPLTVETNVEVPPAQID